jgi:hypothetical protein
MWYSRYHCHHNTSVWRPFLADLYLAPMAVGVAVIMVWRNMKRLVLFEVAAEGDLKDGPMNQEELSDVFALPSSGPGSLVL